MCDGLISSFYSFSIDTCKPEKIIFRNSTFSKKIDSESWGNLINKLYLPNFLVQFRFGLGCVANFKIQLILGFRGKRFHLHEKSNPVYSMFL